MISRWHVTPKPPKYQNKGWPLETDGGFCRHCYGVRGDMQHQVWCYLQQLCWLKGASPLLSCPVVSGLVRACLAVVGLSRPSYRSAGRTNEKHLRGEK